MTITWDGAAGLFTRLGKVWNAIGVANTARLTTVYDECQDITDEFDNVTPEILATIDDVPGIVDAFRGAWDSPVSRLKAVAEKILVQMVKDDNQQPQDTVDLSVREVIRQMVAGSKTVDYSVPAIGATPAGTNVGDGTWVLSVKRGDGLTNENILAEDLIAEVTGGTAGQETITIRGELAVTDKLSQAWPGGSGANVSITTVNPEVLGANLVTNGGMEDEDDRADTPDDWEIPVGTIGTTIGMTDVEIQTVAVSGTPTSGYFVLYYTNAGGFVQATVPLIYGSTASAVQTALQALEGLEAVTVTQSGTTPNLTYTVTFNGVGGNVAQLTSTENFDTGSVGHATTNAGDANVFAGGKALVITGNASELTCFQQEIDVEALTQYAASHKIISDGSVAAGAAKFGLWDGSDWIDDEQGVENSLVIDLTATNSGSWDTESASFRLPRNLPDQVYLRWVLTTAITNAQQVWIDDVAIEEMTELYDGGPYASHFRGAVPYKAGDGQQKGDNWTLAATNTRAGTIQEYMERTFDMREKGLLLPSASSGNIADSLVG